MKHRHERKVRHRAHCLRRSAGTRVHLSAWSGLQGGTHPFRGTDRENPYCLAGRLVVSVGIRSTLERVFRFRMPSRTTKRFRNFGDMP